LEFLYLVNIKYIPENADVARNPVGHGKYGANNGTSFGVRKNYGHCTWAKPTPEAVPDFLRAHKTILYIVPLSAAKHKGIPRNLTVTKNSGFLKDTRCAVYLFLKRKLAFYWKHASS